MNESVQPVREDLLYTREKSFKLKVTSKDGFEATLEGSYLNEPLRALIIGRYVNENDQTNFNFSF